MDVNEIFARNLKFYVIKSGKTQSKVASDIGVSKGTFSDWVAGRSHPRMDRVQQLAEYFGISKSNLLEDGVGSFETEYASIARVVNERPLLRKLYYAIVNVSDDDLEHIILLAERLGRNR